MTLKFEYGIQVGAKSQSLCFHRNSM